jgi:hypothetical protein
VNSELRPVDHRPRGGRRRHSLPGIAAILLAILLASMTMAAAACGPASGTPSPYQTEVPIGPTPWPSGTVGQYGLRIDPSLLARLPETVDAYPLLEDALTEGTDMQDPDLPKTFDRFAAAAIGDPTQDNWLNVAIGHLNPDAQGADVYQAWVAQYATGACSQANGVSATSQSTINDWFVDVASCGGGPVVYTLRLSDGVILSMFGMGSRDLGRNLIEAIYQ